jgi:uncharacterized protein YecT (DUF1311 family)
MRSAIATAALLLAATLTYAADPCEKAVTDAQLIECESKAFSAADAKLNVTYNKLAKLLDAEGKKKLKEVQRAWIAYRDANAVFVGDLNRGDTAERLNSVATMARMTEDRTKELQSELEARSDVV